MARSKLARRRGPGCGRGEMLPISLRPPADPRAEAPGKLGRAAAPGGDTGGPLPLASSRRRQSTLSLIVSTPCRIRSLSFCGGTWEPTQSGNYVQLAARRRFAAPP